MSAKRSLVFIPILFVVILCVLFLPQIRKSRAGRSPGSNIILISIDTLRADHLGCYGYAPPTTPYIDIFRRDAVLFEKCMAQSASTLTSHASILTSLVPAHHGAFFAQGVRLPGIILTLAEVLKANGYKTASFNDGGQIAAAFGLDQGFDLYKSMDADHKIDDLNFDRIFRRTKDWLDGNGSSKFFLFLHTYETHAPYTPKKANLDLFEKAYSGPLPPSISEDLINQINKGAVKIGLEDKAHIVAAYDAEIRSMDESFGALMDYLKARKLYDRTIIIFTSDHGEEFGEHGIMATHSHTLFNELLHVPLLVKFVRSRFASGAVASRVRSIDILPTVLDVVDIPRQPVFEGVSLLSFVRGRQSRRPIYVVSERDMMEIFRSEFWSIMDERWKLYDSKLYDLAADPGEMTDVSAAHLQLSLALRRRALRTMELPQNRPAGERAKLDEEAQKRLKALGYVR